MIATSLLAVLFALPANGVLYAPLAHAGELTTDDLKTIATHVAVDHNLNVEHFLKTIDCESHWNPRAVGDGGLSHGLVQIYRPAHTDISVAEADDPFFALTWMAVQWENNKAYMWTCWRELVGVDGT